ncbi:hypothetical protein K437DRAFT_81870 [Tilletiaria anomala UBC 951]|uniref:Shugoshin C-terminal domain-containing protein n=1 Tax=Tilletiaria anomala (strain ATCC 24038 / CBS 436.72 / UBC 951) TaxID=1037660 RepID=A0A066WDR7_TILAU|nr:uncharacterized protein K437DRAFT_81870 [Tilletiaria anomala UBC 951]KDN48890.1 hypothetical protein K437DRAFT_81870 [Tilletiaria anomala UBC 951]
MPPATRRELRISGINGINSHTLAMDDVLDTFEQFKRKHITQNRDIIKNNALAQLRIRELESRMQDLEAERAAQALEFVRAQAQLDRFEHQIRCVEIGWKVMSQGLPPGFRDLAAQSEARRGGVADVWRQLVPIEPHRRPPRHISLENSTLPAGVVRSIARNPSANLQTLTEVSSAQEGFRDMPLSAAPHGHRSIPEKWQGPGAHQWYASGVSHQLAENKSRNPTPRQEQTSLFPPFSEPATQSDLMAVFPPSSGSSDVPDDDSQSEYEEDFRGASDTAGLFGTSMPVQRRVLGRDRKPARSRDPSALLWSSTAGGQDRQTSGIPDPPDASISGAVGEPRMIDIDGAPSPISSPALDFDAHWAAVATAPILHTQAHVLEIPSESEDEHIATSGAKRKKRAGAGAKAGKRTSRRNSGMLSVHAPRDHATGGEDSEAATDSDAGLSRMSSFSSLLSGLSEFDTEEEMDGEVTPGVSMTKLPESNAAGLNAPLTAGALGASSKARSDADVGDTVKGARKKAAKADFEGSKSSAGGMALGGRKRKVPTLEDEETVLSLPRPSTASTLLADGEELFGRAQRTRKSVNYALPKLNTKMRKPDPTDLVPAANDGSSRSSTRGHPSARHAASTGDLAEIRKQRLSNSAEKDKGNSNYQAEAATPLVRKISKIELQGKDDEVVEDSPTGEDAHDTPDADTTETVRLLQKGRRHSKAALVANTDSNSARGDEAESKAFDDTTVNPMKRAGHNGTERPALRRASQSINIPVDEPATRSGLSRSSSESVATVKGTISATPSRGARKVSVTTTKPVARRDRPKTLSATMVAREGLLQESSTVGPSGGSTWSGPQRPSLRAALANTSGDKAELAAARSLAPPGNTTSSDGRISPALSTTSSAGSSVGTAMRSVQPSSSSQPALSRVSSMQKKPGATGMLAGKTGSKAPSAATTGLSSDAAVKDQGEGKRTARRTSSQAAA